MIASSTMGQNTPQAEIANYIHTKLYNYDKVIGFLD